MSSGKNPGEGTVVETYKDIRPWWTVKALDDQAYVFHDYVPKADG